MVWLRSIAWKVLLAFAAAAVVVLLTRGVVGDGVAPPVGLLLAWGSVIVVCTGGALALVVRRDLSLPWSVVVCAVGYNTMIVAAKFVLAPHGLYEVNRTRALTSLLAIDQTAGVLAVAALVSLLYAFVYLIVYRHFRRRLSRPRAPSAGRTLPARRTVLLAVLVVALAAAGATGGWLVVAPLILAGAGLEYLDFVLSSSVSLLVGLALGVATWLLVRAFGTITERARLVGDATVLVSFFWVGLAFLALYHVLWVVYMLVLITIWPLRAVVPK